MPAIQEHLQAVILEVYTFLLLRNRRKVAPKPGPSMKLFCAVLACKSEPAGVTLHGCWTSYRSLARSKAVIW